MNKLSLKDIDVENRKVLMRVDFNVPLAEPSGDNAAMRITNDKRILAALPSIQHLLSRGARLILMSHLGRPKGQVVPHMSLAPVQKRLAELLEQPVQMAANCVGPEVQKMVDNLAAGEVLLLENLRFHSAEEANEPSFAQQLASLGEIYVNDAFGTAHRAHASTVGVTQHIDTCAAGFLMDKELTYFDQALSNPQKPFVAILGGAKVSDKILVIEQLLQKVQTLIIGGGMAYTFIKAQGGQIGQSIVEQDRLETAKNLIQKAEKQGVELLLPADHCIADRFAPDAATDVVAVGQIPEQWMGLDIGPQTIELFSKAIQKAQTLIWNGPMGVFEMPAFATGTNALARTTAQATASGLVSIIGGGDTAAAVIQLGLEKQMSHVSTGGGASLEYLEGKILPGVAALSEKLLS